MTIRQFATLTICFFCLGLYDTNASGKLVLSVNIEPGITKFTTPVIDNREMNVENNFTLSYHLGLGYTFNNYIGIASGLTYYTLRSEISSDRYSDQVESYDSEGDFFIMNIQGENYSESAGAHYLQIPMTFLLNIPLSYTFNILFEPSLTYSVLMKGEFETQGNFSYRGYYPDYNLTLSDLPEYGFEDDVETNYTGKMTLRNIAGASIKLGLRLKFSSTLSMQFGGIYGTSFSPLMKEDQYTNHPLVSPTQFNSAIGAANNQRLHRFGGFIGLRFSFL